MKGIALAGAAVVVGFGLFTNLSAGEGCCAKGSKASLGKIEVKQEFKSKEDKLSHYKKIYGDISHEDLVEAIESGSAVVIDVNKPEDYKNAHVTGSVNFYDVKAFAAALPEDKNSLVIPYCGGPKCGAWIDAAQYLTAQGYTNVKHYSAGIKGWLAQTGGSKSGKADL